MFFLFYFNSRTDDILCKGQAVFCRVHELTSILILKKSRSWGKSRRGKEGAGDGGEIYFSPGEMYFSPHLLPSRRFLPQGLIYPLSPIFLSGKRSLSNDNGDVNENGKKAVAYVGKTTTLHVHLAFFVHLFAVTARLRREYA